MPTSHQCYAGDICSASPSLRELRYDLLIQFSWNFLQRSRSPEKSSSRLLFAAICLIRLIRLFGSLLGLDSPAGSGWKDNTINTPYSDFGVRAQAYSSARPNGLRDRSFYSPHLHYAKPTLTVHYALIQNLIKLKNPKTKTSRT